MDLEDLLDRLFIPRPLERGLNGLSAVMQDAFTLTALDARRYAPAFESAFDREANADNVFETFGISRQTAEKLKALGFKSTALLALLLDTRAQKSADVTKKTKTDDVTFTLPKLKKHLASTNRPQDLKALRQCLRALNKNPQEPLYSIKRLVNFHRHTMLSKESAADDSKRERLGYLDIPTTTATDDTACPNKKKQPITGVDLFQHAVLNVSYENLLCRTTFKARSQLPKHLGSTGLLDHVSPPPAPRSPPPPTTTSSRCKGDHAPPPPPWSPSSQRSSLEDHQVSPPWSPFNHELDHVVPSPPVSPSINKNRKPVVAGGGGSNRRVGSRGSSNGRLPSSSSSYLPSTAAPSLAHLPQVLFVPYADMFPPFHPFIMSPSPYSPYSFFSPPADNDAVATPPLTSCSSSSNSLNEDFERLDVKDLLEDLDVEAFEKKNDKKIKNSVDQDRVKEALFVTKGQSNKYITSTSKGQIKDAAQVTKGHIKEAQVTTKGQIKEATVITKGQTKETQITTKGQTSETPSITKGQTKEVPSMTKGQRSSSPPVSKGQTKEAPSITIGQLSSSPSVSKGQKPSSPVSTKGQRSSSPPSTTATATSGILKGSFCPFLGCSGSLRLFADPLEVHLKAMHNGYRAKTKARPFTTEQQAAKPAAGTKNGLLSKAAKDNAVAGAGGADYNYFADWNRLGHVALMVDIAVLTPDYFWWGPKVFVHDNLQFYVVVFKLNDGELTPQQFRPQEPRMVFYVQVHGDSETADQYAYDVEMPKNPYCQSACCTRKFRGKIFPLVSQSSSSPSSASLASSSSSSKSRPAVGDSSGLMWLRPDATTDPKLIQKMVYFFRSDIERHSDVTNNMLRHHNNNNNNSARKQIKFKLGLYKSSKVGPRKSS